MDTVEKGEEGWEVGEERVEEMLTERKGKKEKKNERERKKRERSIQIF